MKKNDYKLLQERDFYYYKLSDSNINRMNNISKVLGEDIKHYYLGKNNIDVTDLHLAKFNINYLRPIDGYQVTGMSPHKFMELIKPHVNDDTRNEYMLERNIRKYHKEIIIQNRIKKLRGQYYKGNNTLYFIPHRFESWKECPKCNLRPMVFDTVYERSTMCGCGSDDGHFKIESNGVYNSYSTIYSQDGLLDSWNKWVITNR